jgi:hypothetical protein
MHSKQCLASKAQKMHAGQKQADRQPAELWQLDGVHLI